MNDKKLYSTDITKDPGPWQITEEQIHEIKKGNPKAIIDFAVDNLNLIKQMAKKYFYYRCYDNTIHGEIDELVNQVIVDLPFYRYNSRAHLYKSIMSTFYCCSDGGITHKYFTELKPQGVFSLDQKISEDEERRLVELLVDDFTPYEALLLEDLRLNDEKILKYIAEEIRDPKEQNKLFCYLFTDLPDSRIEGDEYENYKRDSKRCAS